MRYSKILIIFLVAFFLQSCGIKFWYNKLDWLVSWQVDDFVELSSSQEDALEQLISLKTEWHRLSQLPQYVLVLEQVIADVESGNVAENYDAYANRLSEFYHNIVTELAPEVLPQIANLNDQQVSELMENLEKEANEAFEKSEKLKPEKRFEKLVESLQDNYQDWTGTLTKSQKALIKEQAEQYKPTRVLMFEYRQKWREAFGLALLERQYESGRDALMSLIKQPRQLLQNPELQNNLEFNEMIEKQYLLKMLESLSGKQRKKVLNKLQDYKDDFQDLIEDK